MRSISISPDPPSTALDPYATLSLPRTASESEIRTAYKKLALRHHPDKVSPEERDAAHVAFQNLALAYAILSDAARRRRYDATGSTAETLEDDADFDWRDFFRAQYEALTVARLDDFANEYRHSEEERQDVLKAYAKAKGRMGGVFSNVMLSNVLTDDDRFRAIIDQAIKDGEIEALPGYTNETKKSRDGRRKKAEREAQEAEQHAKDLENIKNECADPANATKHALTKSTRNGTKTKPSRPATGKECDVSDLAALIQQRGKARASTFLENLEVKYAGKENRKRKVEEPPEESFRKTEERRKSTRNGKKAIDVEKNVGLDLDAEPEPEAHRPKKAKKRVKVAS